MDPIAETDQKREEVRQAARIVGAYYVGLIAEGVDTYGASILASGLQSNLLFESDDDDDA